MRINFKKLYDFTETITLREIYLDITEKYTLTNLDYEYVEAMDFIVQTLYGDYKDKRINYRAYIEKDMNARIFMELRRNALLKFDDMEAFCEGHSTLHTLSDIKEYRKASIQRYMPYYEDLDWQYALLIKDLWHIDIMNFFFDFDICFKDRTSNFQRVPEDYRNEFLDYMGNPFTPQYDVV